MTILADQTVLVTGPNRGMGREYVTQLLDRGLATVYAAARNPDTIEVNDSRVVAPQRDPYRLLRGRQPEVVTRDVVRQVSTGWSPARMTVVADEMTRQVHAELGRPIGQW